MLYKPPQTSNLHPETLRPKPVGVGPGVEEEFAGPRDLHPADASGFSAARLRQYGILNSYHCHSSRLCIIIV